MEASKGMALQVQITDQRLREISLEDWFSDELLLSKKPVELNLAISPSLGVILLRR